MQEVLANSKYLCCGYWCCTRMVLKELAIIPKIYKT